MSSSWESREGNSAAAGNTSSMDTSAVDTFAAEGTSAGDPASSLYEGKEGGPDSSSLYEGKEGGPDPCASTWISGRRDYEACCEGGSYPGGAGAGEGGGYIDNPRVEGDPVSGGASDLGDGGESGSYAFDGGGGAGAGEGGAYEGNPVSGGAYDLGDGGESGYYAFDGGGFWDGDGDGGEGESGDIDRQLRQFMFQDDPLLRFQRRVDSRGREAPLCTFVEAGMRLSLTEVEGVPSDAAIARALGLGSERAARRLRSKHHVGRNPSDAAAAAIDTLVAIIRRSVTHSMGRSMMLGNLFARGYIIPEAMVDASLTRVHPMRYEDSAFNHHHVSQWRASECE